jgi:hypothetical protein
MAGGGSVGSTGTGGGLSAVDILFFVDASQLRASLKSGDKKGFEGLRFSLARSSPTSAILANT